MVAIKDMEMPSCCMNCELLGKEEMYCAIRPRKDLDVITVATTRPDWCPLVEENTSHNNVKIFDVEKLNGLFPRNKQEQNTEWTSKIN